MVPTPEILGIQTWTGNTYKVVVGYSSVETKKGKSRH